MIGIALKIVIGLFIYFLLPDFIFKNCKLKKKSKKVTIIVCKIISFLIFFYVVLDILNFIKNIH